MRTEIVELALAQTELSPRELACRYTDEKRYFVSESSVYRILKAHDLITSPAYVLLSAADAFKNPTKRVHEMWQTDFTYLRIIGWGLVLPVDGDGRLLALHHRVASLAHDGRPRRHRHPGHGPGSYWRRPDQGPTSTETLV